MQVISEEAFKTNCIGKPPHLEPEVRCEHPASQKLRTGRLSDTGLPHSVQTHYAPPERMQT